MLSIGNVFDIIAFGSVAKSGWANHNNNNNNMTTKVVDGIASGLGGGQPSEYYYSAHTSSGKLYFCSRKGVNQPKYSFFHRTTLLGGYVSCLSIQDKTWAAPVEFPSIDEDENREDMVFSVGDNLYNLIYSRYDGFQYIKCMVWKDNKWNKMEIEIDPKTKLTEGHRFELAQPAVVAEEETVYLVAYGEDDQAMHVSKLKLGANPSLQLIGSAELQARPPGWCIYSHVQGGWLYCLMGSQGCGFRWEPERLIVGSLFDFKGTMKTVNVGGDHPRWAFGGPRNAFRLGKGTDARWLFIGGSLAQGMTQTSPSNEIWQIKFDPKGESPEWEKVNQTIPAPLNSEGACYATDHGSTLFLADNNAIYQLTV